MGKLSSIEDVEARRALEDERPADVQAERQDTPPKTAPAHPSESATESPRDAEQARAKRSLADQEEDFHGISTAEPLGIGHTVLRAAAVVVCLCAIAFVLNYWFHFI